MASTRHPRVVKRNCKTRGPFFPSPSPPGVPISPASASRSAPLPALFLPGHTNQFAPRLAHLRARVAEGGSKQFRFPWSRGSRWSTGAKLDAIDRASVVDVQIPNCPLYSRQGSASVLCLPFSPFPLFPLSASPFPLSFTLFLLLYTFFVFCLCGQAPQDFPERAEFRFLHKTKISLPAILSLCGRQSLNSRRTFVAKFILQDR